MRPVRVRRNRRFPESRCGNIRYPFKGTPKGAYLNCSELGVAGFSRLLLRPRNLRLLGRWRIISVIEIYNRPRSAFSRRYFSQCYRHPSALESPRATAPRRAQKSSRRTNKHQLYLRRNSREKPYYSIGIGCSVEPGKASKAILAVCQEGDTCIVHAFGEITIRTEYNIKRVIGVGKLCTDTDGMTFLGSLGCEPVPHLNW